MYMVGLTGGMGSGKSTVARELEALGAEVIDADVLAREVVAPGEPALEEIRERFGAEVLREDGTLDRPALAGIVFGDDTARADLNAITHPRIGERIAQRIDTLATAEGDGTAGIVVVDHPLLVETGQAGDFPAVVVVVAPVEVRVRRLQEGRGIDPADARARIESQVSDEERRAAATHVIDNGGDRASLRRQVAEVWSDLRSRADAAER